jgi:type I restriction enzyme R subunit
LERVKQLARQVSPTATADAGQYPAAMDTPGKRSLYDNLDQNEALVLKIDTAVRYTKKADWIGHQFKEREVANAVREESAGYTVDLKQVMDLLKNQDEYQ